MAGSFAALYYHIVFSTKDREPLLTPDVAPRIYGYLGGIISSMRGIPIIVGGVETHVHILTSLDKTMSVAQALCDMKSGSSKWIHEMFPELGRFAWQEGYGAFSVSAAGLGRVRQYIETQREHHTAVTFQEEFLDFLHRHEITYDERYIWK